MSLAPRSSSAGWEAYRTRYLPELFVTKEELAGLSTLRDAYLHGWLDASAATEEVLEKVEVSLKAALRSVHREP